MINIAEVMIDLSEYTNFYDNYNNNKDDRAKGIVVVHTLCSKSENPSR